MPTTSPNAIGFHPLADIFPLMEGDEFDELVADIKANGLHQPIDVFEDKILDGRNRYRACLAAGVAPRLMAHHDGCTRIGDPAAYVVSANIHRRHLSSEQKRDIIAKLIKAQPEKSDRQIAKQVKADDKTVASVRHELEGRSEIPNVETTTDTKGRKQPKQKPRNPFFAKGAIVDRQITKAHKQPATNTRTAKKVTPPAAIKAKGIAGILIALDRDVAHQVYEFLWNHDRHVYQLAEALGRGLGLDGHDDEPPPDNTPAAGNGADPEASAEERKAEMAALDDDGLDIPGAPRRVP